LVWVARANRRGTVDVELCENVEREVSGQIGDPRVARLALPRQVAQEHGSGHGNAWNVGNNAYAAGQVDSLHHSVRGIAQQDDRCRPRERRCQGHSSRNGLFGTFVHGARGRSAHERTHAKDEPGTRRAGVAVRADERAHENARRLRGKCWKWGAHCDCGHEPPAAAHAERVPQSSAVRVARRRLPERA